MLSKEFSSCSPVLTHFQVFYRVLEKQIRKKIRSGIVTEFCEEIICHEFQNYIGLIPVLKQSPVLDIS